ncbi:MAG: CHRD domain-containing protein [Saprospiraceae bacterium]|nr:CHRD domain-containing protein [Saprospiraceae bacterium]
MKSVLLSLFLFVGTFGVGAQIYKVKNLSGTNVEPPNNSPGIGTATVTIASNTMRVQATFSGLNGTTTAAHIHAATAVPGTGTAGVATSTPSFPGFPIGVTSGSYDMTYDMTQASSYNGSYLIANGGTAESAFSALKTALNDGRAYFNIHTTTNPGGEIRGFYSRQTYQNLSSMLTFSNLSEAISSAASGDIIQQISNAEETAPIELPLGLIFVFPLPYTLAINTPP